MNIGELNIKINHNFDEVKAELNCIEAQLNRILEKTEKVKQFNATINVNCSGDDISVNLANELKRGFTS